MATLYEIDAAITSCMDMETGEILDMERLEALTMERDKKLENIACFIKNLDSDAAAFAAEEKAFADRRKAAERKADSLREYLTQALQGEKFSTSRCAVSFRVSEAVEITEEILVPYAYMTEKRSWQPNKTAIKSAIKAGEEIDGCQLVKRYNINVR